MDICLILATDKRSHGIGKDNKIVWNNKEDMKWFKSVTTGNGNNAVIMGRKTFNSLNNKPLKNRLNFVISNTLENGEHDNYIVVSDIIDAVNICKDKNIDNVFIIGGKSIYAQAMAEGIVDIIFIDEIETDLTKNDFDTFYYPNLTGYKKLDYDIFKSEDDNTHMQVYYNTYGKQNTNDFNYFNIIANILNNGRSKQTRAGETLSIFNQQIEFDLRKGLPILTTKKIYSKACIHELLWFLKGSNNIKYLIENNTHIWDDDAYRYYLDLFKNNEHEKKKISSKEEFLEKVMQNTYTLYVENNILEKYKYGDVGPIYGPQWINWNGINQLDNIIYTLKTNPNDRRLLVSAWNVSDINKMALPPCHYMFQLYVDEMTHEERVYEYQKMLKTSYEIIPESITEETLDNSNVPKQYLSCMWQQRSVDTLLGLPFDILSYSILLSMIAKVCNMVPYRLIGTLGDTHIYKNQLDNIYTQLYHNPFKYDYAKLELADKDNIYDFTYDDIKILNYQSYPSVKYKLSVGL